MLRSEFFLSYITLPEKINLKIMRHKTYTIEGLPHRVFKSLIANSARIV